MRIFFSILLLISALRTCTESFAVEAIPLSPGEMNFYSKEEFVAPWESEEAGRINGDLVLEDFRRGGSSQLSALCSAESIKEMALLRVKLQEIIKKSGNSGYATDETLLAARVLSIAASSDIVGLSAEDLSLLEMAKNLQQHTGGAGAKGITGSGTPADHITLFSQGAAAVTSGFSFSPAGDGARALNRNSLLHNSAPGRSFETAHADYYRLFLYVRDYTGARDSQNIQLPPHYLKEQRLSINSEDSPSQKITNHRVLNSSGNSFNSQDCFIRSLLFFTPPLITGSPGRPHISIQHFTTAMEGFHEKA